MKKKNDFIFLASQSQPQGISVSRAISSFAGFALVLFVLFSMAACDKSSSPRTSGELKITDFPERFEGKYVIGMGAFDEDIALLAAREISDTSTTLAKVDNGQAALRLWMSEGENDGIASWTSFDGNGDALLLVLIYDIETIAMDDNVTAHFIGFGEIQANFANGKAQAEFDETQQIVR